MLITTNIQRQSNKHKIRTHVMMFLSFFHSVHVTHTPIITCYCGMTILIYEKYNRLFVL